MEGSISESRISLFRRGAIGRFLRIRCTNRPNTIPPKMSVPASSPRIANVNFIT